MVQMDAYKLAMEEIKPALVAYNTARRTIGQTFAASMTVSATAYKAVRNDPNATAEAKLSAKTTFEAAKTAAVATRQAALTALGTAPVKPAKPEKPTKPVRPVRP
jgi:soluble lytic murein transglycosylase-like protein